MDRGVAVKKWIILGFVMGLVGITLLGGIFYYIFQSEEYRAAKYVAIAYLKDQQVGTNLAFRSGGFRWTQRGDYRLCRFAFEIKNRTIRSILIVRYTQTCPLNKFEVGWLDSALPVSSNETAKLIDPEYRIAK